MLAHRIIQGGFRPLTTLSFVASSNTGPSAAEITIPSTARAGDWCVIAGASVSDTVSTPDGWTALATETQSAIYAKKLEAGDPDSDVTVFSGTTATNRLIAAVFRPDGVIVSFAAGAAFGSEQTANAVSSQNINSDTANPLPAIVVAQYWCANANVSPRSASPEMDEINGADAHHFLKYKIYAVGDTPVDHSVDMDDEGALNVLQSGFVEFS